MLLLLIQVTVSSSLRVIGGSDFVEYDNKTSSQELITDLKDRTINEASIDEVPLVDDELFNLEGFKRRRR